MKPGLGTRDSGLAKANVPETRVAEAHAFNPTVTAEALPSPESRVPSPE